MTTVGTCALCCKPASILLGSHIVPEFFYTRLYTPKHRFTAIPLDEGERLAVEQKGYREYLLCSACETKLSQWEGKLALFASQIVSNTWTACMATQIGEVTEVTGVDYSAVKMAVLSIFWRMSIAQHPLFAAYKLGPYEEEFRALLDKEKVPTGDQFPILMTKGVLDGEFQSGILLPMECGWYDNNFIMQSVVLNGIVIDCIMTSTRLIPSELIEFSLQPNGRVLLPTRSYEDLGMDLGDFSKRMGAADVKAFYQKHS
jgi:hypothetical protein